MTNEITPATDLDLALIILDGGDAADVFAHATGMLDWEDRLAEHDERESYGDARDDNDLDAAWDAWAEETYCDPAER